MAVTDVTTATFPGEVLEADKLVVVDYWADWCGPCKQLSPIVEELSNTYAGQVKFVKVDTSAETALAAERGILSLPTLEFIKGGEIVQSISGGKSKNALKKVIEEHL